MQAREILDAAAGLVGGVRNETHGDKLVNHAKIVTLWNAWMQIRREPQAPLTATDVALMMVLLKAARTQAGSFNMDDFTDMAGYAGVAGEIEWRLVEGDG